MTNQGALSQAEFNDYNKQNEPEWHRILRFLDDMVDSFTWHQFLTFKKVLEEINPDLYYVVFENRPIDESLFCCFY